MNKIIVSIVLAVFLYIGINKVTEIIYHVEKPKKSAYQIEKLTVASSDLSDKTNSDSGNILALFASYKTRKIKNWLR